MIQILYHFFLNTYFSKNEIIEMRKKCVGKRNVRPEPLSTHTKCFKVKNRFVAVAVAISVGLVILRAKFTDLFIRILYVWEHFISLKFNPKCQQKHTLLNSPDRMWFHLIYLFVENFRIYIHAKFYREVNLTAFEEKYWFFCWRLFVEVCEWERERKRVKILLQKYKTKPLLSRNYAKAMTKI